jgi:3-oxoacyl-[acyl-carrier-protein] synthase III
MGAAFIAMKSYYEFGAGHPFEHYPKQVLALASKVIQPILEENDALAISHLIVATSCPDSLAPSVGQEIHQAFYPAFVNSHVIDLIQGCAGGVTALLLGSQLALAHDKHVLVVTVDAARKACDPTSPIHSIFGNGAFACLIKNQPGHKGLLHQKSRQYENLSDVVRIRLGHDADELITKKIRPGDNPRKYLGIDIKNDLAIQLLKKATHFFEEFVREAGQNPDILILHQVNPKMMVYLRKALTRPPAEFIDISSIAGNCGTASIGIALDHIGPSAQGKKVFLCSFGTGGVITAGMWQC